MKNFSENNLHKLYFSQKHNNAMNTYVKNLLGLLSSNKNYMHIFLLLAK